MKTCNQSQVRFSDTRVLVAPSDSEAEAQQPQQQTRRQQQTHKKVQFKSVLKKNSNNKSQPPNAQSQVLSVENLRSNLEEAISKQHMIEVDLTCDSPTREDALNKRSIELPYFEEERKTDDQFERLKEETCEQQAATAPQQHRQQKRQQQNFASLRNCQLLANCKKYAPFANSCSYKARNRTKLLLEKARDELLAGFVFAFAASYVLILARISAASAESKSTAVLADQCLRVALVQAFGLATVVACLTQVFADCQLTAAVSLALLVEARLSARQFAANALAQFVGALLAAECLSLLTSTELPPLQVPQPNAQSDALFDSSWSSLMHLALPSNALSASVESAADKQRKHFAMPRNDNNKTVAVQHSDFALLLNGSQMFVFQLLASCIVVSTFVGSQVKSDSNSTPNIDERNTNSRSFALSSAYFCASLLSAHSGNFVASPLAFVAVFIKSKLGSAHDCVTFSQHWVSVFCFTHKLQS